MWTIDKGFVDITKDLDYFVASVEFAVAQFNDNNPEENIYRLLEVGRAQKKVSSCAEHYSFMNRPGVGEHWPGLMREYWVCSILYSHGSGDPPLPRTAFLIP